MNHSWKCTISEISPKEKEWITGQQLWTPILGRDEYISGAPSYALCSGIWVIFWKKINSIGKEDLIFFTLKRSYKCLKYWFYSTKLYFKLRVWLCNERQKCQEYSGVWNNLTCVTGICRVWHERRRRRTCAFSGVARCLNCILLLHVRQCLLLVDLLATLPSSVLPIHSWVWLWEHFLWIVRSSFGIKLRMHFWQTNAIWSHL